MERQHTRINEYGWLKKEKNLVNFDARDDVGIAQAVDKGLAVLSGLVKSLLEENGTRDVITEARSGKQKLPIGLTVLLSVIKTNRSEPLPTSCIRLINRQDTSPRGCYAFLLPKSESESESLCLTLNRVHKPKHNKQMCWNFA